MAAFSSSRRAFQSNLNTFIQCSVVGMLQLLISTESVVFAQEPVIDRVDYSALQPGSTASLTLHGTQLANAKSCWTPFAAWPPVEGHDPKQDKAVSFTGVVPAETTPGIYPIRMITAGGVSEAGFVVVDDLPQTPLDAASESVAGQAVSVGSCVVGSVNAVKPRYFNVELGAGQQISVEVFARRLNSEFDPVLRVSDSAGAEVAFCDDVPGLEGDAVLQFTAAAAGTYRIEMHDVRFSGGGRHFFHLRVGPFAAITAASPRVAVPGQVIQLISGSDRPPVQFAVGDTPAGSHPTSAVTEVNLASQLGEDAVTTLLSTVTAPGPLTREVEPNNDQVTATAIPALSGLVTGTIQSGGDVDWYRLTATEPGMLVVTTHDREVGSPADLVLRLFDAAGTKLAENDEAAGMDAQLAASLAAAGEYLLQVTDLSGSGGTEWTYDLELNSSQGRVELILPADRLNIPRGGSASLTATLNRLGVSGPVVITASGLPAAVTMPELWLHERQKTIPVTLSAAGEEQAGTDYGPLSLGIGSSDPRKTPSSIIRLAPPAVKKADADRFRSFRFRSDAYVAVRPAAQFSLTPESSVVSVKKGETAAVVVKVTRHADWSMPIDLGLAVPADQLPPGVSCATVKLEGEQATLSIVTTAETPPGRFTLFAQGTAKKDKETATHPVPPVLVEVTE
ncbi:MAG: PPC domain-containing protein [Planctomycetaceae bacterium]|nr:PPC domain-containing protein [Planctomycetaceae bacterium]